MKIDVKKCVVDLIEAARWFDDYGEELTCKYNINLPAMSGYRAEAEKLYQAAGMLIRMEDTVADYRLSAEEYRKRLEECNKGRDGEL